MPEPVREQVPEPRPESRDEAVTGTEPDPGLEPAAPAPLGVERPSTGHPAVDALLGRLADADHLTADGHLEVYEDVHRGLRHELTSLDTARPAPTPTPQYDHRS